MEQLFQVGVLRGFEGLRLQHTTGQINGPDFKSSKIDFMVNVSERSLENKPSLHQFVYAFEQNSKKYGVHQRTTPFIYKLTSYIAHTHAST